MRKPKSFGFGSVRVRVIGGPDEKHRWRWRAERYVDSRAVSVWSGWATLEVAKDPDGEVAQAIKLGLVGVKVKDRAAAAEDFPTDPKISDLAEYWATAVKEKGVPSESGRAEYAAGTVAGHIQRARRLKKLAGETLLTRVSSEWAETLRARLLRMYSPGTAGLLLITLKLMLEWGRTVGLESPRIDVPSVAWSPTRKGRTPTSDEVLQVFLALKPRVGWERVAYRVIWATGARSADLVALRGRHIDNERGRIEIPEETKTGTRAVFVGPEVMADLMALGPWEPDEPVFGVTSPGHFRKYLREAMEAACAELGIARWTSHAFRRHAIRSARRKGEDLTTTAKAMGNTIGTIWKHYDEADEEDVRAAAERMKLGTMPEGLTVLPVAARKGRTRKQWRKE